MEQMAFVPEGQHDRRQARSAWESVPRKNERTVPEGTVGSGTADPSGFLAEMSPVFSLGRLNTFFLKGLCPMMFEPAAQCKWRVPLQFNLLSDTALEFLPPILESVQPARIIPSLWDGSFGMAQFQALRADEATIMRVPLERKRFRAEALIKLA